MSRQLAPGQAGQLFFIVINTLDWLTETTLGMGSVTRCTDLEFKAEISIYKEEKINSTKSTVIE